MDDVASMRNENANLRKIQNKLLQWEVKNAPLAALSSTQQDVIDNLSQLMNCERKKIHSIPTGANADPDQEISEQKSNAFEQMKKHGKVATTHDFLLWFDKIDLEIHEQPDALYSEYLQELQYRTVECEKLLTQIAASLAKINDLKDEYHFVANKTSSLNIASEKLIHEQNHLMNISEEIRRRLLFFSQVEQLSQRFLSPTLSVTSDGFKDCLNKVDECLDYLKQKATFKEAAVFTIKYKQCLAKAVLLMRNYVSNVILQATEQMRTPKDSDEKYNPDTAFALYYGKFSLSAVKVKMVSSIIEERIDKSPEYKQLLIEIHQCYLSERAKVMSPAVEGAIRDLRAQNKGDHCTLVRSACAFLVHICQDEHRLFYQFFSLPTEELNSYLAGLCTILYDNLRPYIIHINHLETLAEICSILRSEMLEEHVQQCPDSLEAFGKEAFQLLQDVQERLVFRAHLYLQSDILNYNPSPGDLAYPEKLEMMESIAYSLQEPSLRRSDSKNSISSSISYVLPDQEAHDTPGRNRFLNSPADLHGMWYPTVRRTLVCLSRLYRCVDRPIFQGLSQEALKHCIQSITQAAAKISAAKSAIDGELFEIKHLLILREQIAPFRVDFTIKETSLDFSKVKTAAFGLLQKRKQLFSLGSNNALLEFLLEGTPQVKEHLLDSRKEVDHQLKLACEQFIKDAVYMLISHILIFLKKAQTLLLGSESTDKAQSGTKINYALRQSPWASPQQVSGYIQESQRLIKSKLSGLQRSMQLYLSNRDTEFIIFRPIRNNIISAFVKVEQILTTNGYTQEDMIIASCPSAEQVSVLISSASILNDSSGPAVRKTSIVSTENVGVPKKPSEETKVDPSETTGKAEEEVV